IADLVVARGRHERERFFGKVAMRIDHEESVASRNVLRHDVQEKRRLADAGRAEDRHMAKPLIARERHRLAMRRLADVGMRAHSRDCLRGPRYGSWGNRLSAGYAETTPDMDRRRSAPAIPVFILRGGEHRSSCFVWRRTQAATAFAVSFGFWISSRKDKSGSRLGTPVR